MIVVQDDRLEDDWVPTEDTRALEEIERETREQEAKNKAVVLEMIGDLPEADAKPPPNMLFICKLNPVTTEEVLTQNRPGLTLDTVYCLSHGMGHMWRDVMVQACSKQSVWLSCCTGLYNRAT